MEKVKLPKEVAKAIESLKNDGFSNYAIIGMLYSSSKHQDIVEVQVLDRNMGQDKMHPDTLIEALVNGYEVEQTPEDKVREYVANCIDKIRNAKDTFVSKEYQGKVEATRHVLDLLGIEIEGVNA